MNTIRFNSRAEFVAALEDRRKFWHDYDAKITKDHKAAEQAWLTKTRGVLREALKLDYTALTKELDYGGRLNLDGKPPSCPTLQERRLDRAIASLNLTSAKVFNVASDGAWSDAHYLLTADPYSPASVC